MSARRAEKGHHFVPAVTDEGEAILEVGKGCRHRGRHRRRAALRLVARLSIELLQGWNELLVHKTVDAITDSS